ncbi:NUDIX hydrolase [Nocardia asiatica]|uniref:NUDIX hydrolase n=1 Tax=Nocardia asiatica TaxID=209252 RepID=UPI003EDEB119
MNYQVNRWFDGKGHTVMSVTADSGHTARMERHKVTGDVHLLLRRDDEVLFGRRENTGFEDGAWHLPSGHLEAGESVVEAVVREAAEEIGVRIELADVQFSHVMHNSSSGGRMAFFFTVRSWRGEPTNLEPDKCSGLDWFAMDALPDRMISYCRTAIQHIAKQDPFSTFGW